MFAIFKKMAKGFAILIFCVMAFMLIQPAFAGQHDKCEISCCKKQPAKENKNGCASNCNPFFNCAYCQYITTLSSDLKRPAFNIYSASRLISNNTIIKGFPASCWHPPDLDSD